MPSIQPSRSEASFVLNQIVLSPSDTDYLDQLIPSIREYSHGNKTSQLLRSLSEFAEEKESEIERICSASHQEFVTSVHQLLRIREGTVNLTSEILGLNQSIQSSTERLVDQKKSLVESRGVRQNINDAANAIEDCLQVLRLANQVHDLLAKKSFYAALRALDELQDVHLRGVTQYKIADMIRRSVPATQKTIADAVINDLSTWLFRIREMSQYLGELSFYHTDLRKQRQQERATATPYLAQFRLNSAIELVADEHEEYDVLNNDDLQVDFSPLLECLHIHQSLGQMDKFRAEYAATRRKQKDLLLPLSISLVDEDMASLHTLLEDAAGFAIVERATMKKAPTLRSGVDVDELWDSLCQTVISLIGKALPGLDNAEQLLKVKNLVFLFIQTMDSWRFPTTIMNGFLLTFFEKYAQLLKRRFSDDFLEIVSTDDYMPMPIQNAEEYQKVIDVSWYVPPVPVANTKFPCVLPFSQMYPLCCIDIRNFLNQFYFFSGDDLRHSEVVDETLRVALDDLLCDDVCGSLVQKLSVQYIGQIVQILVNLEHFETACMELERLLIATRSSQSGGGVISLNATEKFRSNKKTAEKRIFELVNSKIDDLVETAEYDWTAPTKRTEPNTYVQTLTQYLDNIMETVLISLPTEIKGLIYFDAISHAAKAILALPLSPAVTKINPNGIAALSLDVHELAKFVSSLGNPILLQNLDELQQTVSLMGSDNSDEFYDSGLRNKKYGQVNPLNGPVLLEKITKVVEVPQQGVGAAAAERLKGLGTRFGMR